MTNKKTAAATTACKTTPTKRIYLDHAATTPLDTRVLEAMMPFLCENFGNANTLYSTGRDAFHAMEGARKQVAGLLGAKQPDEIIFTSGGTESDNAALLGIIEGRASSATPAHIIVSAIEHHAVLNTVRRLAARGHAVSYLKPDRQGSISPKALEAAMREDTALVSIMTVNNELGTIQPVRELAEVAHAHGALFHTDAVQALGKIRFDLEASGIDAASFSGHKIYGPKGVGVLYLRRSVRFATQMSGGGQEGNRRSGTQNVAGIVGFAKALELAEELREAEQARLMQLRERLVAGLVASSEKVHITVNPAFDGKAALPDIIPAYMPGIEGETLVLRLDAAGFEVSAGSACSSASFEPSHVLRAIGLSDNEAYGSLRISLGRMTCAEDIDAFITAFTQAIKGM